MKASDWIRDELNGEGVEYSWVCGALDCYEVYREWMHCWLGIHLQASEIFKLRECNTVCAF